MQTIDTNRHSKCFQVLYEDLTTVAKNIPNSAVQPHMNWSWGLLAQSPSFSIQAWVARPNWWKNPSTKPWKPSTKQPETSTEFSDVFGSWRGAEERTQIHPTPHPQLSSRPAPQSCWLPNLSSPGVHGLGTQGHWTTIGQRRFGHPKNWTPVTGMLRICLGTLSYIT